MIESSEGSDHDEPQSMGLSQRSESQNIETQNSLPQNALVFIQQAQVFNEQENTRMTFANPSVDSNKQRIIEKIDMIEEENVLPSSGPTFKKDS